MSQLSDLIALLGLAAAAGTWLKTTRARERAVDEARRQCVRHGVQLLDETVGLRRVRVRRTRGRRQLEWGYAFEVSATGTDRMDGELWMRGDHLAGVRLPHPSGPETPLPVESVPGNVVPLRRRLP